MSTQSETTSKRPNDKSTEQPSKNQKSTSSDRPDIGLHPMLSPFKFPPAPEIPAAPVNTIFPGFPPSPVAPQVPQVTPGHSFDLLSTSSTNSTNGNTGFSFPLDNSFPPKNPVLYDTIRIPHGSFPSLAYQAWTPDGTSVIVNSVSDRRDSYHNTEIYYPKVQIYTIIDGVQRSEKISVENVIFQKSWIGGPVKYGHVQKVQQ